MSEVQLLFFAEQMEEGRRVNRGDPSVQQVERGQTAQFWRGARGRVGGREGSHDLEVLRVKDIAGNECYRVCLLCCLE